MSNGQPYYSNNYTNKPKIGLAPFTENNHLCGFVVTGRWPETTWEWLQTLVATVHIACLPGLLPTTTIFAVNEEKPENPEPNTVGLMIAERRLGDKNPLAMLNYQPSALLLLHPPSETSASLPECDNTASGCILLPGIPYLGLEHRAGWVEAERDTVISMRSKVGIDPVQDPDTAVLATLLAA